MMTPNKAAGINGTAAFATARRGGLSASELAQAQKTLGSRATLQRPTDAGLHLARHIGDVGACRAESEGLRGAIDAKRLVEVEQFVAVSIQDQAVQRTPVEVGVGP